MEKHEIEEMIIQARADLAKLITPGPVGSPLLALLATMITPSSSAGNGGGAVAANAKSVLDLSASGLMQLLRARVAREVGLPIATPESGELLANQLRLMLGLAEAEAKKGHFGALSRASHILGDAVEAINELIEPTPIIPIKDSACPECEAETIFSEQEDGRIVISPALAMRGAIAYCRAEGCLGEWRGVEEMRTLAAHIAGGTVVALDLEKRRREKMDRVAEEAAALRAA